MAWRTRAKELASGRENLFELVRRDDFELFESAITRPLVGAPAAELGSVAKAIALHVIVGNLNNELRTQRLPGQIFSGAPSTLRAGHSTKLIVRELRPVTPGMIFERILAVRLEKPHELSTLRIGKARAHSDVLEIVAVVKAEE